jgi:hypothetical protein
MPLQDTIKESHENNEDNLASPTRQEIAEHSVKVDPENEEDKLPDERNEENKTAKNKVR